MSFTPTRSLITGASSGIGAAFARALAARGSNLVLVARRKDRLDQLAAELDHVQVTTCPLDLSLPNAAGRLRERVHDLESIDTVINCAGFGTYGTFVSADPMRLQEEISLSVAAVVDLTHMVLPTMLRQNRGALVNVASFFAYQPTPNLAVYGATKAFLLNFTEALWYEVRGTPVKILAVSPGPTRTEFFNEISAFDKVPRFIFQSPDQVVQATLQTLERRRVPPSITTGGFALIITRLTRMVSRRRAINIAARVTQAT